MLDLPGILGEAVPDRELDHGCESLAATVSWAGSAGLHMSASPWLLMCPQLGSYVFSEETRLVEVKCEQSWLLGQLGRSGTPKGRDNKESSEVSVRYP